MPAEVGGIVNPFHLLATGENPESCHATDLTKPWAVVEKGQVFYGKRLRRIASLQETVPVEMLVAEDKAGRDRILAALLEQKQKRFEETRVPGFDAQPEKREFYERATEAMAESGALHLSALSFGGDIVAAQWSLIHDRRYYALVGSFDGSVYGRYSPGKVLYLMLIKRLHEAGVETADLGVGDEAYKKDHCDVTIALSVMTEAQSLLGRLYLARAEGLKRLRASALWQKLRPLKWVMLRKLRRETEPVAEGAQDKS
ncbi:GNAT family N-acetyltransferase [Chenggangzhangella methanolivorans]|uniref:GNAT family N-acetyltransferase n=2 Tax=Chenggangzhangella methanolivorans TaxID=1437009 RepID=A0A9E6RA64_9HYPH|nr:GNAT family N-acetyltransferase [Chenggangzhangella methanolivorans]QZO01028.1 GNAT family N-acetyltransferase [Chenggangzhangella methanolivorans]